MTSVMMPKEQSEKIQRIQKEMLERTNMTENEAYDFAFRCWQCGLDFTEELEKENANLKETIKILTCTNDSGIIQNLKAENQELKEQHEKDFEIICKQAYLLNNKHIDRPFIEIYQKAIEILKDKKFNIKVFLESNSLVFYNFLAIENGLKTLTREEYKILNEVLK